MAHAGTHAAVRALQADARFRGYILSPHLTLAFTTDALVGAPPGVELVGPAMPSGPRGETPFPWERLDADRPLVYMSLGSQLYYHPDVFAKVIEATRATSAQLVLSVGELVDSDLLPADDERRRGRHHRCARTPVAARDVARAGGTDRASTRRASSAEAARLISALASGNRRATAS